MYDVSLFQVKTREVTMKSYEKVLKMLKAELVCKPNSIPIANKALGCANTQAGAGKPFYLQTSSLRRQNMPNYARPTFIWRVESRLMILRTMVIWWS